MGLGIIPCSPKNSFIQSCMHTAWSQGYQCSATTGFKLTPVCQTCTPPLRRATLVARCPLRSKYPFSKRGLEKTIDPLGKAILGPPKQHGWQVPRGVSLKEGGKQLPVAPGPPQKGAGICSIHQPSRQHSSSLSHSTFLQLLQCHFEGIQIMSEALMKRFFPSP